MIKRNSLNKFPKIICYPIFSEKALNLYKSQQYSFIIQGNYDKKILKVFFEFLFNCKITKVLKFKTKHKKFISNYYKVIIKLKKTNLTFLLSYLNNL